MALSDWPAFLFVICLEEDNYTRVDEALWFYRYMGRLITNWLLHRDMYRFRLIRWPGLLIMLCCEIWLCFKDKSNSPKDPQFISTRVWFVRFQSFITPCLGTRCMISFTLTDCPRCMFVFIVLSLGYFSCQRSLFPDEIFVENLRYETNYTNPMYFDLATETSVFLTFLIDVIFNFSLIDVNFQLIDLNKRSTSYLSCYK